MGCPRQFHSSIAAAFSPVAFLARVPFLRNRDSRHGFRRGAYSFRRTGAHVAGTCVSDSAVLRLFPVARGLQIFCRPQQNGGIVAAKSDRAVAADAKKPAHLASQVAMIDAKRQAGSLADRAGATLPLEHHVVVL